MDNHQIKKKKYLILGGGRTGKACQQFLEENQAKTEIWDDNDLDSHLNNIQFSTFDELINIPGAPPYNARITPFGNVTNKLWNLLSTFDELVVSPGAPPTHPLLQIALSHNITVTNDIDLFFATHPNKKYFGITGTNGKSTTTALLHHIFKCDHQSVQMGGNIGVPICTLANDVDSYILEISSYQASRLEAFQAQYGAIINIMPDHLEWHGTMEDYIEAKMNLLMHSKHCFISIDDPHCTKIAQKLKKIGKNVITLSQTQEADFTIDQNSVMHQGKPIINYQAPDSLKGKHNQQNILCAASIAFSHGITPTTITHAISSFQGLPMRQELIKKLANIVFINDSKATNIESTIPALERFSNILWLAGGIAKSGNLDPKHHPNFPANKIEKAYFWGQSQADLAAFATNYHIKYELFDSMEQAVEAAIKYAKISPQQPYTLLLSPACASFDQFKDFVHRGKIFNEIILK